MFSTSGIRASSLTLERGMVVSASGATIEFSEGRELLDFESGGMGHGPPGVVDAVLGQMRQIPLATRHFLSLPLARFASTLATISPGELEVSYLCNSGSEAVEGSLKLACGFHRDRRRFIALQGSYHGATLGSLSVCGVDQMRAPFTRLPFEAQFAPSSDELVKLIDRRAAAVIVEPWPGGAGRPHRMEGWLREVAGQCEKSGTLLIVDETRSGIGRCGERFALEIEGVSPDVLVLGGALGGGVMPLGGYVTTQRVNDRVYARRDPTLHASATGGNPAACAAGMAILELLGSSGFLAGVRNKGEILTRGLSGIAAHHEEMITEVRTAGLAAWVFFQSAGAAMATRARALEAGLALGASPSPHGSAVGEMIPPLLVREEELHRALEIFDAALG